MYRILKRLLQLRKLAGLVLAAFVLNNIMWFFIDGFNGEFFFRDYSWTRFNVSAGFTVLHTLLSLLYMRIIMKLFPIDYERKYQAEVYVFIIFLLNNAMAFAVNAVYGELMNLSLGRQEYVNATYSTSITVSFVICVYLNYKYQQSQTHLFRENAALEQKIAEEREAKLKSQLGLLKTQLSPHFMFNNFSILSSLIMENPQVARTFLNHLSKVYRYVIHNAERTVIQVSDEIVFLQSYVSLVKLRYEGMIAIDIEQGLADVPGMIPPMSLQLLVENAVKHNNRSSVHPLQIHIYTEHNYIVVANSLQPIVVADSTHIGQRNIKKRYELLGAPSPLFYEEAGMYIAKLPII